MFAAMPETLEELDEAIHSLQTRIDCLTAVDNTVVSDFEAQRQRIERLTADVSQHEEALVQHRTETAAVKQRWLEPVKELIGRISSNFSQYFAAMKCAGEVDVSVPDNPVRACGNLHFLLLQNWLIQHWILPG